MGFPVPLAKWFQEGPVRDFIRDVLQSNAARSRGFIRTEKVEDLLNTERAFGRGIWGLLCLELWMKAFFDTPLQTDLIEDVPADLQVDN